MKRKEISIIVVEPFKHPHLRFVTPDSFKKIIGREGLVYDLGDCCLIYSGKRDVPFNRVIKNAEGINKRIRGIFLICGLQDGEPISLPSELCQKYQELLWDPEIYTQTTGAIKVPELRTFELWQTDGSPEGRQNAFLSYSKLSLQKKKPNSRYYKKVYEGILTKEQTQEDLFYIFNCNTPVDFNGRKMSVSDVIVINDANYIRKVYYCDNYGFQELTTF